MGSSENIISDWQSKWHASSSRGHQIICKKIASRCERTSRVTHRRTEVKYGMLLTCKISPMGSTVFLFIVLSFPWVAPGIWLLSRSSYNSKLIVHFSVNHLHDSSFRRRSPSADFFSLVTKQKEFRMNQQ